MKIQRGYPNVKGQPRFFTNEANPLTLKFCDDILGSNRNTEATTVNEIGKTARTHIGTGGGTISPYRHGRLV